jgi:hypothetical protein
MMAPIYTSALSTKVCSLALAGLFFVSACSSDRGANARKDATGQDSTDEDARNQRRSEVYRSVKDAVWMVYTHNAGGGGAQGLATMVDPSGVLVTNYQLVADVYGEVDPVGITVENSEGRQFVVSQILLRSAKSDYVTLRIRPRVGESFRAVRIAKTEPQVGDECYVIGNPNGTADSIFQGTISGYRDGRDYIKSTIRMAAGSTGAPILNSAGEVVGITTASTGKTGSDLALNIQHIPLPTAGRVAVGPGRGSGPSAGSDDVQTPRQTTRRNEPAGKLAEQRGGHSATTGESDTSAVPRRTVATTPRLEDLPSTAVGEGEHGRVKNAVQQYFSAARSADYSAMEAALAPIVKRFFAQQNIAREAAVASSREYDLKNSTRVLTMDLHWEKAVIRALSDGYICTFPMDYSVSFRGMPKSFTLAMTVGLSEDFLINYIAEKIVSRQK